MGLLDKIKQDAQKSGGSKGKFFYVKSGDKRRVRFLNDFEDGFEIVFHDSFEANINVPCRENFGKSCPYCEEEGLRTRSQYAWSVWDYEAKEVKIFMYPMNQCSPVGGLAAAYELYGSIIDRDFVIGREGKQQSTQYSVNGMDREKFRNEKAKPFSRKAFLEILDKAYPDEYSNDEGEAKMKPKSKASKTEDDEDEKELPWNTPKDYQRLTAKQLYDLCEEREIEAEPKMKQKYYIDLLEEYDEQHQEEADDEWGDEEEESKQDYSSMSAKELYKLCDDRGIEALPKKPVKYYVGLLEEYDKSHEEWEDDEEDDEDDDWE